MLDVVDQPHWLKSFILRFSVLVASTLDDQAEPSVSRAPISQQKEPLSMAVPEQPCGSLALSRAGITSEHPIAAAHSADLDKAADQGWLPPTLLPPKSDASGKQKQSKKRSKQKAKSDVQRAQSAEGEQPAKKGGSDAARSKAAEEKWELPNGVCMEEAANGKAFSDDSAEDHTCRMEGGFPEPVSQEQHKPLPNGHAAQALHGEGRGAGSAPGVPLCHNLLLQSRCSLLSYILKERAAYQYLSGACCSQVPSARLCQSL